MMEWPAKETSIEVKPMSDEQAERVGEFLKKSKVLRDSIRKRRKGKLLPSSWKLIRRAREERSKRV